MKNMGTHARAAIAWMVLLGLFGLSVIHLVGCGSEPPAHLEEWIDGAWLEHPVIHYEISGSRDGASTHALATLEFEKSRRLHLDFEVVYNPTPALGEGHWTLGGTAEGSGEIVAESVRFVGGQGEGPSIGGRYQLNENGSPRFRVELPLRSVGQPNWQVE